MFKTIILFLMLVVSSSAAIAQTQYSDVIRDRSSSGLSIVLDGTNTELLLCEGGCNRHRVSNFKQTRDGFTFKIVKYNLYYKAKWFNDKLVVINNVSPNHQWVLYPCNKKPASVTCYNHGTFRLEF